MVMPRLVEIILYVSLILAMHAATLWALRRVVAPPRPACPHCGYDLEGARWPRCPECGRAITVNQFQRAARRRAIALWVMAIGQTLVLVVLVWSLGRTALELRLIADRGPNAFLPGYSLVTGVGGAVLMGACAILGVLLACHVLSATGRASRRYAKQMHDQGVAVAQRLTDAEP